MVFNRFRLFLSASVPSRERAGAYRRIPDAQLHIEEAVISLARAVFRAGGQLICGGHPSITPLLAFVAAEVEKERDPEKDTNQDRDVPVVFYQSRAFERVLPRETSALFQQGHARIIWVESEDGEVYDATKEGPQCTGSLLRLRQVMLRRPLEAMVCIGGMEGIEEEVSLFEEYHPRRPVFLLPDTGGATLNLSEESDSYRHPHFVIKKADPEWKALPGREGQDPYEGLLYPYPVLAAEIVRDLLLRGRQ